MAGFPSGKLGGQSKADTLRHLEECWEALSPFQRLYYSIKAHFYAMNTDAVALWIVGMLVVIGLVTFVFKVQPFAAVVIIVISAILGVFAVWLIERPRQ